MRRLTLMAFTLLFLAAQLAPRQVMAPQQTGLDLSSHIVLYGVMGLLVAWNTGGRLWVVLVVGVVLGTALEAVQGIIPGRNADVHDLVGNLVGTLLAVGITSAWRELRNPPYGAVKTSESNLKRQEGQV